MALLAVRPSLCADGDLVGEGDGMKLFLALIPTFLCSWDVYLWGKGGDPLMLASAVVCGFFALFCWMVAAR